MTSGLRMSNKPDLNGNGDDDDDDDHKNEDDPPFFDRPFSGILRKIKNSKEETSRFTRLSGNRFDISAVDDDTFLDGIYQHLSLNKNTNPLVSKLKEIIESEEYDTDSVDNDLDIFAEDGCSNISLALNKYDKHLIIKQMMKQFNKRISYVCIIYLFNANSQNKIVSHDAYNQSTHFRLVLSSVKKHIS